VPQTRSMQQLEQGGGCPECHVPLVDVSDEYVCPNCGIAEQKEPFAAPRPAEAEETTTRGPLGSYMGTLSSTRKERGTRGVSGSNSRYEYIKTISDHVGREDGAAEACERMIVRVGEKLVLPKVVMTQATSIARTLLSTRNEGIRAPVASVSAYSLIVACKIEGVTSANVRDIVTAHRALGRNVSSSSIIQQMLESPFKTSPRSPEDYLGRVIAKLSMSQNLSLKLREERVSPVSYLNSLRETAAELLLAVRKSDMTGKRPCALAASAVYSAEAVLSIAGSRRRRLTQKEVAECSDAAEYTIREQCASLFMPLLEQVVARRSRSPNLAARR